MADTFEAIYACKTSSGFQFRLGENRYRFEKHQLVITDEVAAKELDDFLAKTPAFAAKVQKVDLAAAEALVANHKATHGGAHSGPFSSSAMAQMETDKLEGRDKQFAQMSLEDKANVTDAMAEDSDLILTEKVNAPVVAAVAPALKETIKPVSILSKQAK